MSSSTEPSPLLHGVKIPDYEIHNLDDEIREVVRLREGMTAQGLSATAVGRALFTLRLFKRYCDGAGVDQIVATATSAVREAANGAIFVEQVERDIGLSLQILEDDTAGLGKRTFNLRLRGVSMVAYGNASG